MSIYRGKQNCFLNLMTHIAKLEYGINQHHDGPRKLKSTDVLFKSNLDKKF